MIDIPAGHGDTSTSTGKRPCSGRMSKAWQRLLQSQLPVLTEKCAAKQVQTAIVAHLKTTYIYMCVWMLVD